MAWNLIRSCLEPEIERIHNTNIYTKLLTNELLLDVVRAIFEEKLDGHVGLE